MGTRPVPSASGRLVLDDESGSGAPGQVFGRVTLSQVAREAGVSLATASRAFNGSRDRTVREDMRQRVLEAAERLRYQPDANAQAMVRGRTTSIGLIVHDIADPYFSSIAAGVGLAADAAGLTLTLASTQYDSAREPRFAELLTRQRARAIVIAGGRIDDDEVNEHMRRALADFRMSGGTVALIGQPLLGVDTVEIANRSGAADLARVLHGLGYRRFGVLRGPTGHLTATDRLEGFVEALDGLGCALDPAAVVTSAFTRDGGYEGMRALIRGPEVEVVFAVNDVMAVGAMAAARDAGLQVPADVAVAGFDDIVTLRDISPSLTTVRVPLVEVGTTATELALSGPSDTPRLVRVPGTVVVRDSTPRTASASASAG